MNRLHVLVRGRRAGELRCDEGDGKLSFVYDGTYTGPDVSVAIPRADGICLSDHKVRTWFSGVLPDNEDVRAGMSRLMGGGRSTYALLSKYGMDLPGAIQVLGDDDLADALGPGSYLELSREVIADRLERIMQIEGDAWMTARERWSLGGGQPKLAFARLGGEYYECLGAAASNVIVKPGIPGRGFEHQPLDEAMSMRLARAVGLPCASVDMESFAGVDALVVQRFDRLATSVGIVERVHQEDLCQAMSVYPDQKYPSDGGPDSAGVMELLQGSSDPDDRMRFFDALIFNHLIATPDAHGKNYSLLHVAGDSFRLAPLYDIASIAPYMKALRDLGPGDAKRRAYRCAMSIGGENRIGRLRRSSISRFAKLHGMDEEMLSRRVELIASLIVDNLEPTVNAFGHWQGADEIGSLLVARVRALCEVTVGNVRAASGKAKYIDLGEVQSR